MDDEDARLNPRDATNRRAMAAWDAVVEDMAETAAAREADGWETVVCHPGDVTVVSTADERGLDVLLPDDEYEAVAAVVAESTFDEYEAFRAEREGIVYAVVELRDAEAGRAFFVPAYYEPAALRAVVGGDLTVSLRRLDGAAVELVLDDPSPLFPAES